MNHTNNLFYKLKNSLSNTRKKLGDKIIKLIRQRTIDSTLLHDFEDQLLTADINIHTTKIIIDNLKKNYAKNTLKNEHELYRILRQIMLDMITPVHKPLLINTYKPFIILITGVNGVGKTTTIGKLAYYYQSKYKKNIMIAAGDTRRAAAIDQLKILIQKNISSIPIITNNKNCDPASIAFDAIQTARLKNIDILLIDTAGRLQNDTKDMVELKKIIQVIKKIDKNSPHEIILVLDANIGQNSINQVHTFHDIIKITGIIMTKLDGSAKGGILFSIADHHPIPIRYLGIGQKITDLQPFKPKDFIEAIF